MSSDAPQIHVTRWGTEGPEVLMIHGGPQGGPDGGAETFSSQQALGDDGWQLVLPDRPGHGKSPTRGPEDMEVDAVWVAEMLGDGAHLVGHSYGGVIALAAAGMRPDAVKSLTLLETPVFSAASDDPDVIAFGAALAAELQKDVPPPGILIGFAQLVNIPLDRTGTPPTMEQVTAMGEALTVMRQPDTWDATAALEAVRSQEIGVLTVTGGWSPAFDAMAAATARITDGEFAVVETGHHFPQYAGEEFNQLLGGFLHSVEARAASEV